MKSTKRSHLRGQGLLRISLILSLFFFLPTLSTQGQSLHIALKGGIITGTPFGQIPEGATGGPGTGLYSAIQGTIQFSKNWGVRFGAAYAQKNAYYDSPISGKVAPTQRVFGIPIQIPINVPYKGRANGRYDNVYIDIPLGVVYRPNGRFSLVVGGYMAYLLQGAHLGSVDIKVLNLLNVEEDFDETERLNQWDFGVMAGADMVLLKRLSSFVGIQVGMQNINSENPEGLEGIYRNIYLNAGLKYRLMSLFSHH